jgi:hypothetical protein
MQSFCLENELYRLEFDADNGSLCQLHDKIAQIDVIAEPRLAESFRLLLPLPDMRANYILGTQQKTPQVERLDGNDGLRIHWAGPLRNERGTFNLDMTIWIKFAGEEIQFRCEVQNRTPHSLTEVWYAMIGGMRGLGHGDDARDAELFLPRGNRAWQHPIFRDFSNTGGPTLGVLGGEHSFGYPGFTCMPWMSLFHPKLKRALYAAALEESPRVKAIRFALEPGLAENRADGNWPRPEEVGDLPFGMTMNWVHFPHTKPGETFTSAPVVLRFHDGGWRESAELYRKWFSARYPVLKPGSTWIRRETTLLHIMFMLPEDNINLRFADIPRWARDAKERRINHLMIAGWQVGGHDRGYPYYTPDPRLGTWEELESGIRAAHALAMRVSFFVNCQPIDMTTEWYQNELHKYRVLDPYGVPYFVSSWGMGTLSARTRYINATPLAEMNPAHPEVRALLVRQFRRLVEIGADGLHIDKYFQTPFDFNPLLKNTSPDRAHHEGVLKFAEELVAACRAINPEFCFSFEGSWDRLFQYSETLWWGNGDDAALKAVFPQMAFTSGIEQPWDFNKVNRAVLQGEHLLIGPGNYNRGTDYPPMQKLFAYIAEITRIRRELFEIVSLGEKLDASEGVFRRAEPLVKLADGKDVRWTVFRDTKTVKRAVVLVNRSGKPIQVSGLRLEGGNGACRIYQPFEPTRDERLPLSLRLPAETAVFIAVEH